MSDNKQKILVVDDQPENIGILADALKENYQVSVAVKGEVALKIVNSDEKPDLVLLDVMMPGMDGYEVCKQIRSDDENKFVPIVFVSAADTLEERLNGYEAGGNDYVVKPFSVEEVLSKVKILLDNVKTMKQLKSDVSNVTKTAMVAMTSAGEMGMIIDFFRKSFSCYSLDELADVLLENLADSQLNSVVELSCKTKKSSKALNSSVTPLEISVIEKLKSESSIFDFGARTVFSYQGISILIKNMPLENIDLYGRIKDNVALLAEGASERIRGIESELALRERQQKLHELIEMTEQALCDIGNRQREQRTTNELIMSDLERKVYNSFLTLGLKEEQEEELIHMIKESADKEQGNYEKGELTDKRLAEILIELRQSVHATE